MTLPILTRSAACSSCPSRIYIGERLACQEIARDRPACGESAILPDVAEYERRLSAVEPWCPRWIGLGPATAGPVPVVDAAGQRAAWKRRRRARMLAGR